jgi:hypothetical protein
MRQDLIDVHCASVIVATCERTKDLETAQTSGLSLGKIPTTLSGFGVHPFAHGNDAPCFPPVWPSSAPALSLSTPKPTSYEQHKSHLKQTTRPESDNPNNISFVYT